MSAPFDVLAAVIQAANVRDRPIVVAADAEDATGRDYPDEPDPEERGLLFSNIQYALARKATPQSGHCIRGTDQQR